jgi:antitoxin component YwqK of YwqJK toxin-antitoxin module
MDGILIESNSYKRGILEDFDDNNPAIVTYYSNGNVKFYSRYNSGRLNNSKTGLSAHQEFYPNGNIRVCCYYKNGKLEDFNGVAAYRYYNLDGYITICENYCDGVKI